MFLEIGASNRRRALVEHHVTVQFEERPREQGRVDNARYEVKQSDGYDDDERRLFSFAGALDGGCSQVDSRQVIQRPKEQGDRPRFQFPTGILHRARFEGRIAAQDEDAI